mmetsp:Transcript_5357/g.9293  ORF Transcript_5357/g.9293 Transcript_5357/m.9293 type:complete len:157 (-) Transcript_5357:426-896(-)
MSRLTLSSELLVPSIGFDGVSLLPVRGFFLHEFVDVMPAAASVLHELVVVASCIFQSESSHPLLQNIQKRMQYIKAILEKKFGEGRGPFTHTAVTSPSRSRPRCTMEIVSRSTQLCHGSFRFVLFLFPVCILVYFFPFDFFVFPAAVSGLDAVLRC